MSALGKFSHFVKLAIFGSANSLRDYQQNISVKYEWKYNDFHSTKSISKSQSINARYKPGAVNHTESCTILWLVVLMTAALGP